MLLGQKIFPSPKTDSLILNDASQAAALYYRTVYKSDFISITKKISSKIFNNISFIIVYLSLLGLSAYILFNGRIIRKIAGLFENKYLNAGIAVKILAAGIFLRILVAPFFVHIDMASGLWVPYMMFYHNPVFYALDPDASFHLINQLFHLPVMMFSKIFFSDLYSLWESVPYAYTAQSVFEISCTNSIFLLLLLNKLPFLIADIIFYILLFAYLKENKNLKKGLIFWLLNPISIYVVYMIGRFELYAIVFIMLGLINLKKENIKTAMLMFGISAAFRQYPIMFLPLLLIINSTKPKDYLVNALCFLAPVIFYNMAHNLPAYFAGISATAPTGMVSDDQHSNMLFHYEIRKLVLFAFFYFFLLISVYGKKNELKDKTAEILFLMFNTLLAFGALEPQYYMWVSPFIIILLAENKISISETILFCLLFFGLVLQWDRAFSTYLAMPLYPELFYYLPAPARIINEFYRVEILNKLIVSFFIALNVYWYVKLFKNERLI